MKAPFAAEHNVTSGQLCLLLALHQQGSQTVSSLAQMLYMADANVSTQIKRLGEKGLVERRRLPEDERLVCVSLTGDGSELARQFADYTARCLQAAMCAGQSDELRDIKKGLLALERLLIESRASDAEMINASEAYKENSNEQRA